MSTRTTQSKLPQVTLLFWIMKISATTLGETGGDLLAQTLKLGYAGSTLILVSLLVTALVFWKLRFGTISIARVDGFELELMYWITILCSNTLGTALGDYLSDSSGLGFGGGALLIATVI